MNELENGYSQSETQVIEAQNTLIRKVYAWMGGGLLLTALFALFTISSPFMVKAVFSSKFVFYGLLLAELGLVFFISSAIDRISPLVASAAFVFYSALNGVTLSVIFLAYTASSIASTFVISATMFGAMSLFGLFTKRDLTSWGSFLFMGLIGVVIASLVNIFLHSPAVSWVLSAVGVIVFTGLTAYDTWKIKERAAAGENGHKAAIIGALDLYLDFINLFLMLLRLFGGRR